MWPRSALGRQEPTPRTHISTTRRNFVSGSFIYLLFVIIVVLSICWCNCLMLHAAIICYRCHFLACSCLHCCCFYCCRYYYHYCRCNVLVSRAWCGRFHWRGPAVCHRLLPVAANIRIAAVADIYCNLRSAAVNDCRQHKTGVGYLLISVLCSNICGS